MEVQKGNVPPKSLIHIKVILQVSTIENDESSTDDYISDEQDSDPVPTACGHNQAEIVIIDDKSLQINTIEEETHPQTNISQKLTFDSICDSLETLQKQFYDISEKLISQQENCCLIRFAIQHKTDPVDFVVQFINKFNEQLLNNNCKLQHCDLICSDIQMIKFHVPLHNTNENLVAGSGTSKSNDGAINRMKEAAVSHNAINHFRNVQALLTWLLHEYSVNTSTINSHEKLEFIFTIYDKNKRYMFTVKLYLFGVYVNLMNFDDRNHWQQYMLHMGEECSVDKCDILHDGLTANLLDHVEAVASKHSYFIFDVPMGTRLVDDTVEILQMADAVIKSRLKVQKILREKCWNKHNRNNNNENKYNNYIPNVVHHALTHRRSMPERNATITTAPMAPQVKSKNNTNFMKAILPYAIEDSDYSKNDFDNLRSWYEKIDESLNKLCKSREAYYSEYFDKKNLSINNLLEAMVNNVDSLPASNADCYMGNNVRKLYENYNEMRMAFEQLPECIKDTPYKETLQVYLDTKKFDNREKAHKLQVMYLKKCQADLNENIEQVISKINCEQ